MSLEGKVCAICFSPISADEARTACSECKTEYHADCWQENGGCAVYGCSKVPVVEQRSSVEIPVSYWGQENKNCPQCGQQILAAAKRCRHCGATFESARPQDAAEFQRQTDIAQKLPATKKMIVCLFILNVVTCLAPIGAIWGLIWLPANREEIRALPALYGALGKIGLAVGIGQTVALVAFTLLYAVIRH